MLFSLAACSSDDKSEKKENEQTTITKQEETTTEKITPYNFSSAKVGDYITFGSYEQDNDTTNGAEEIEWLVIDKQDEKILVISKYALDCQMYHEELVDITWANCTLRSWLNNEFINTAFLSTEKSMIPTVTVKAEVNPDFQTDPGVDTKDKVFLLSINEIKKYFPTESNRSCSATAYAIAQGASEHEGNCYWWLRTPGGNQSFPAFISAAVLDDDSGFSWLGNYANRADFSVRPAIWINL